MNEIELTEAEQKELIEESAKDTINESVEDTKLYTFEEMVEIDNF